jgi:hypothetical protein
MLGKHHHCDRPKPRFAPNFAQSFAKQAHGLAVAENRLTLVCDHREEERRTGYQ